MDDQKISDKRKAPDKMDSDVSDSGAVQAPLKRPRMDLLSGDDPVGGGNAVDVDCKDGELVIADGAGLEVPLDLLQSDETGIVEMILAADDQSKLTTTVEMDSAPETKFNHRSTENGNGHDNQLTPSESIDDRDTKLENSTDSFKEVRGRESRSNPRKTEEDNNNKDTDVKMASPTKTFKSNPLLPKANSSPVSQGSEIDSESGYNSQMEIEISLTVRDSKTRKVIYENGNLMSEYGRLDGFLKSHNVTLSQNSMSGYYGDVSSQSQSQDILCPPPVPFAPTGSRNRSRWTSSTLGSDIPRHSTYTIETLSPGESPKSSPDDVVVAVKRGKGRPKNSEFRGKNEPKMTSTKISSFTSGTGTSSSSGKLERMLVSVNGDDSSNGYDDDSSSMADDSASKKGKGNLSIKKQDSSLAKSKKEQGKRKTSSAKQESVSGSESDTSKGGKKDPLNRSIRTVSREFSGVISPTPVSASPLEPSTRRLVAKVEGSMVLPLTDFESKLNDEPVDLKSKDLCKNQTHWGSVAPDEPVFARWRDKKYYSGMVMEKGENDTWRIDYDDGMQDVASETHILPIRTLGIGSKGVYSPDKEYKPLAATIMGQRFVNDAEVGLTVKYAIQIETSGDLLWCTRRQLSINEKDAHILHKEFRPVPKPLKAAEVSLENILNEGRTRRTPSASSKVTPASKAKIVGGAFDESIVEDKSAKLKSTPKRKLAKHKDKLNYSMDSGVGEGSKSIFPETPTPRSSKSLVNSPVKTVKESPKKSKQKDVKVFDGFQFFLTAVGGCDPSSSGSTSPLPVIPYDKDEYRELIEAEGGKLIDQVGKENGRDDVFLVSDNAARTVKYIYCLAASIPCVSHKWIQKCLDERTIVPWAPFELNSGWSIESQCIIPSHKQRPLKGFKIYITAGSEDLYNYWKPVLTAAHAILLKPKKGKGKEDVEIPPQAKVLVTDNTCPSEVLNKAHEMLIPVVKPEWLVQTIICGKRADFVGHEKYRVEAVDPEEYEDDDEEDEEDDDQTQAD